MFILINIFGFVIPLVNEETGEVVMRSDGSGRPVMVRRFRTAYNEVARKNAKSTLSSGIGLYMTGADGEGGLRCIQPQPRVTVPELCLKTPKIWSEKPGRHSGGCLISTSWRFTRAERIKI